MKQVKIVLCGIMWILMVMGNVLALQAAELPIAIRLKNDNQDLQAGEKVNFVLVVNNIGEDLIDNIKLYPQYSNDPLIWPFKEVDAVAQSRVVSDLQPDGSMEIEYKDMTVRSDVVNGRCQMKFLVVGNSESKEVVVYPFTKAAKAVEVKAEQPMETKEEGSFSGGEISPVGGGAENNSVPRVIVTGFSTEPKEVKAGADFRLIVHLKNTSKRTSVSNMEFEFATPVEGNESTSAPAFLPKSGSGTVYLESIKAQGTADVAIELHAKADLVQKPYSIELGMKYEDREAAQFEGRTSISIPVKQEARFEFSDIEIMPEVISVGDEANIMCSLYNMGRIKLYNVKVTFAGDAISAKDTFIGNVEPGTTAAIDGMILGEKETNGRGSVKMVVSYEDEGGKLYTVEKEFKIEVSAMEDEIASEGNIEMDEPANGIPWTLVAGGILVLAVLVVVVIIIRKNNRKNKKGDGFADELDRLIEDE